MVLFTLWYFSAISNAGNQLGALTLCRTIAQLRTEQSLHLFKSVNVANSFGRIASLFSCKDVSTVSRVKKKAQPQRGMTCLRMPRTYVLLAARAVMWFGLVAHDAMQFVSPIYLCPSCTTTLHSARTTRRALRAISHCSLCQLQQKKTVFTITDCEVMTTWTLTPNQSATLAAHPWRIRSSA